MTTLRRRRRKQNLNLSEKTQADGKLVAMMGDGTNDAPALAQADVALAMNAGTQAAKEAANMVDLDSDPTKLLEVVHIGKQLLITRGALTTFSIANDVAKYFAIIPALFAGTLPWLKAVDIMNLALTDVGYTVGSHFQCIDYSRVDSGCPERRQVPCYGCRRPSQEKPVQLGARRRRTAFYRHQADRHDYGRVTFRELKFNKNGGYENV